MGLFGTAHRLKEGGGGVYPTTMKFGTVIANLPKEDPKSYRLHFDT